MSEPKATGESDATSDKDLEKEEAHEEQPVADVGTDESADDGVAEEEAATDADDALDDDDDDDVVKDRTKHERTRTRAEAEAALSRTKQLNIFQRIGRYFSQVIAEMRKVVYPGLSETWQMFIIVVVFVTAIMIFTGALDYLLGMLYSMVFG